MANEILNPWRIEYARAVLTEDVSQVGHADLQKARKAIEKKLRADPMGYGEQLHSPLQGLFKLKTAKIRVVYQIRERDRSVLVVMIGPRKTIWRDSQQEILQRLAAAIASTAKDTAEQPKKRGPTR